MIGEVMLLSSTGYWIYRVTPIYEVCMWQSPDPQPQDERP